MGEIKRGKINPSSAICVANAEISAIYVKKCHIGLEINYSRERSPSQKMGEVSRTPDLLYLHVETRLF